MTVVGGLRARLIKESLYNEVYDALDQLNWFDSGRPHLPVTFREKPYGNDETIPFNSLVLVDDDIDENEAEMGSLLSEGAWVFYIDFYAENDALGLHLIRDVKDILQGRMASVGRTTPNFPVYDYRQATPSILFYCDIENAAIDRAHDFPQPWKKHWYSCSFVVVDEYEGES